MNEPVFLEVEQVLHLHVLSLTRFGGSPGIHDRGLLEGSVAQPKQDYFYGGADLFGIAEKRLDKEGQARILRTLFQNP